MKQYVNMENGIVIDGPRYLPINWKFISNFHLLSDEELIKYNWYPYIFVPIDTDNKKVISSIFELKNNVVYEYQQVRDKTPQEIMDEENWLWEAIRAQRNQYLLQTDWTQLSDAPLSVDKKQLWSTYRQQLRDITNTPSPNLIVWPAKPE